MFAARAHGWQAWNVSDSWPAADKAWVAILRLVGDTASWQSPRVPVVSNVGITTLCPNTVLSLYFLLALYILNPWILSLYDSGIFISSNCTPSILTLFLILASW